MTIPLNATATESQLCEKYCVFQRGNHVYGVLAASVREVGLRPNLAVVPDAPPALAGLGRVRNDFVPLLRNDAESVVTRGQETQIIVIASDQGPWGLLVDRVIGLFPLEVSLCADQQGAHGWSAAVMGSATWNGQVVQVLDDRALYRLSCSVFNQYWNPAGVE